MFQKVHFVIFDRTVQKLFLERDNRNRDGKVEKKWKGGVDIQ